MKRLSVCAFIAVFLTACVSSLDPADSEAGWILVDDFESGDVLQGWTLLDAQNETTPFVPNPQISEIRHEAESDNRYLLRKPAAEGVIGNRKALAWKTLPAPVLVGETATFFTRIKVEYFPNNHAFGISNQPGEKIAEVSYNAFEPMIRITDKAESDGTKNDGTLMVITGGKESAKISNPETGISAKPLEPGQWYELWYVVDNALREDGGQTYTLYVRGGEFAERALVYEKAGFRMAREQALTSFMAICNTGPFKSPYGNGGVGYDDIYMAPGKILSSPVVDR